MSIVPLATIRRCAALEGGRGGAIGNDRLGCMPGRRSLAAFLARPLVEFIEAVTVVLAVGVVRGWAAARGTDSVSPVLFLLVIDARPAARPHPARYRQASGRDLRLLFGLRWLRKAILRAAGIIALHDEAAASPPETTLLRQAGAAEKTTGIGLADRRPTSR